MVVRRDIRHPTQTGPQSEDGAAVKDEDAARRMNSVSNGVGRKTIIGLNSGVGAGPLGEGEEDAYRGYRLDVEPELLESTELHILSGFAKFQNQYFMIPKSQPMGLLDLKIIFTTLRKRAGLKGDDDQESLPFEAFQRAFERLFYVMQDPVQFDAKAYDENGDGNVAWGEFFLVYKKRNITINLSIAERVYLTFDHPDSSVLSQIVSALVLITIIISSAVFVLSTMPTCHINPDNCTKLDQVEKVCLLVFVIEFLVRFCTVGAVRMELHDKARLVELVAGWDPIVLPTPLGRLWRFLCTPANIIDLIAIVPGVVGFFADADGGAFLVLRLVRLTRIFRALKSPAVIAPLVVIGRTLEKSTKALEVLAFNLCLGIVIFGSLMFLAEGGDDMQIFGIGGRWNETTKVYERRVGTTWNGETWETNWQESPFQSIPESFWWAVVTAATVGYGDHFPTTVWGQLVGTATMLFSMVILALPVGVMGGTFTQEWEAYETHKKHRILTLRRETAYITRTIKSIDPSKLTGVILFEVWHDHPCIPKKPFHRPPGLTFIGEATAMLELPADRPVTRELKLKLESNLEVCNRNVTGFIVVRYEWTPHNPAAMKGRMSLMSEDSRALELKGELTVTAVRAENLINVACDGQGINPYLTMLCYPTYTHKLGPVPYCVRMPTVKRTCKPQWDVGYTFRYDWCGEGNRFHHEFGRRSDVDEQLQKQLSRDASRLRLETNVTPNKKMDAALGVLRQAASDIRSQRGGINKIADQVWSVRNVAPTPPGMPRTLMAPSDRGVSDGDDDDDDDSNGDDSFAIPFGLTRSTHSVQGVLLPGVPAD